MNGLNKVIIAGNLARDPEVRYTVNKRAWARFSVAVNYRYKDQSGEFKDGVDFVPIVVWGNQADPCGKYLKKGSPVLVEGSIRTRSYEANDGSGKRYVTEVNADRVIFLSSREQGSSGGGYQSSGSGFGAAGGYIPSDEDFGKSIGESGFGGGGFSQGFADDGNGMPGGSESGIPF
ncbi:MAG: single-stranded DNA-binding protein [Synergistaceae bacterium]|nr:single-stranded DNA-binding protein [Synergistaceae bacterium]